MAVLKGKLNEAQRKKTARFSAPLELSSAGQQSGADLRRLFTFLFSRTLSLAGKKKEVSSCEDMANCECKNTHVRQEIGMRDVLISCAVKCSSEWR